MPAQERKSLANFSGAPIGGHATSIVVNTDENDQLELIVGGTVGVLSAEDAARLAHVIEKQWGSKASHDEKISGSQPPKTQPITSNPSGSGLRSTSPADNQSKSPMPGTARK